MLTEKKRWKKIVEVYCDQLILPNSVFNCYLGLSEKIVEVYYAQLISPNSIFNWYLGLSDFHSIN